MQEDEITTYLTSHPEFFEKNASLLADIHLPSPHGSGTISLAERQQLAQRDKISALEERYAELVLNAQDNDAIRDKMHTFFILLQQAKSADALAQCISNQLPDTFNISDASLYTWGNLLNDAVNETPVFKAAPDGMRTWVSNIQNVYCGNILTEMNAAEWLDDSVASIAVLPLKHQSVYGYLALTSSEKERFYVGMGTDFLQKLADHVSAALSRYIVAP